MLNGFDRVVVDSWKIDEVTGDNAMTYLKKKFQALKGKLREWSHAYRSESNDKKLKLQMEIQNIDRQIDNGECGEDLLRTRRVLWKELWDIDKVKVKELAQKAKVKWAIEGDKNSKFFHGIINKRWNQMAIRGVSVNGEWVVDPNRVKDEFYQHFATSFFQLQ